MRGPRPRECSSTSSVSGASRMRGSDQRTRCPLHFRLLPCEQVQVSLPGITRPIATSAWLFDASDGTFLDHPARASGCDGKRWQSWNLDQSISIESPATLRMPRSGTVTLRGAYVHSSASDDYPNDPVQITAEMSLSIDLTGDDSACKAPLPKTVSAGLPSLPAGMKAHGCLQSIAWLLLLFPVRTPYRPCCTCGHTCSVVALHRSSLFGR